MIHSLKNSLNHLKRQDPLAKLEKEINKPQDRSSKEMTVKERSSRPFKIVKDNLSRRSELLSIELVTKRSEARQVKE